MPCHPKGGLGIHLYKGLLRGEDAVSDELLLVCSGEEGGAEGAAGAAALAAAGG